MLNGQQSESQNQDQNNMLVIPMDFKVAYERMSKLCSEANEKNLQLETQLAVLSSRYRELLEYNKSLEQKLNPEEFETESKEKGI